ncbi:NUDIX hydrolase [Streptosporangium sp. NPDC051022]|uniref:NUDIX hydrolase n=1 Tax=Streptosporangium sp. NPDC051022 TaxID=3155752 RepID=UPI0034246BD5
MRWQVNSEQSLHADQWLDLRQADVELPDGRHLDHRLVRLAPAAGAVVVDDRRRVLLIWRHRFITDSWGWEVPMGRIEAGEEPVVAAAREVEEETGWRPGPLRPLLRTEPNNGITDSVHHVFRADGAVRVGPPADEWEAARVDWVPLTDVRRLIGEGDIVGGTTLAALLYVLTEV